MLFNNLYNVYNSKKTVTGSFHEKVDIRDEIYFSIKINEKLQIIRGKATISEYKQCCFKINVIECC